MIRKMGGYRKPDLSGLFDTPPDPVKTPPRFPSGRRAGFRHRPPELMRLIDECRKLRDEEGNPWRAAKYDALWEALREAEEAMR